MGARSLVLANFCYCSHARILVKLPVYTYGTENLETLCKNAGARNVSGNIHPRFVDVLLRLAHVAILLER